MNNEKIQNKDTRPSAGEEVRIKIRSVLYEVAASLFGDDEETDELARALPIEEEIEPEEMLISTMGRVKIENGRFEVSYDETEATGMEGSVTSVSFAEDQPEIVSMMRSGSVSTALVFEERKRHHCIYNTPYMPFEICVHTLSVENKLREEGRLSLDYVIEIRGAQAERTKFNMQILK